MAYTKLHLKHRSVPYRSCQNYGYKHVSYVFLILWAMTLQTSWNITFHDDNKTTYLNATNHDLTSISNRHEMLLMHNGRSRRPAVREVHDFYMINARWRDLLCKVYFRWLYLNLEQIATYILFYLTRWCWQYGFVEYRYTFQYYLYDMYCFVAKPAPGFIKM